jgi:hypothetical protein
VIISITAVIAPKTIAAHAAGPMPSLLIWRPRKVEPGARRVPAKPGSRHHYHQHIKHRLTAGHSNMAALSGTSGLPAVARNGSVRTRQMRDPKD